MALTQAIGPDEAIKLLEMCDMSKHAEKLVSSKGNPDGPLPKWGEPPVDAMNKTPGQKKKKKEVEEDCWDGYKKVGMKKKGKKRVPNCVPTNEEIKTIKVGEDAVGASDSHYVIVKDRKVIDQGKKEDMMKKCGKDERVWLSTKKVGDVVEEKSAQDPDIKDREGTQPAAYHKGLKKTTKAKRDAHFKKHGKKSDDDASAYKDAPGDKKARKKDMPKSKYTKFVDKMMDEEHEFHVKLDHLDGDKRQDKASSVLKKHEKAGHIKYAGSTDKGAIFKAKSKSHADRLHRELKPHATGVEHMNEAMSPESRKAHGRMFKAAAKKKYDADTKAAAQAEREKRLKAKGWVKNDRGGMSKVSEGAEYHVTRPGGSLKKPDSVHKSKTDAMKAAYRLSGNKHRGAQGGQVYRVHKGTVSHGFDTEGRKRHLGLDHGKVTGKKPIGEAKYAVDIEGMPRFYMDSDSPAKVKIALRQMLKKASAVKSVTRTYDTNIKADLRQRLKDASTDMHTNIVSEKLKASDDMGTYVKDFQDSDAPQFKGKSMKKRRQMAIAAKLSAMREGTEAYGKSVNKMADDKKKAAMSSSDKVKLGKVAAMMAKERQMKEEEQKKDHQTISYVTHGGQKGKVQVHKDKAFKALNHYRKNNKSAQFEEVANEAMGDAAHKAAVKHITDLGKKNKKSFGDQRMHIDNHPGKHDEKTRQAAKTINKNQFGNWKKGKNGKMTQEETGSWKKDSGWKKVDPKADRKDEYGNTIKKQNIAKHLAKKAMNKTAEKKL